MSATWQLERGATLQPDGSVRFSVWAPRARRVEIELVRERRRVPLAPDPDGGWLGSAAGVGAGADYSLVLDGERRRPDPVSRFQPEGVHGPSRVVDPAGFRWSDAGWRGVELADLVIYELHVGTFTERGTFDAAIERLPHLVELGVTAVELMPVAEFPGARNWGYDGVCLFAPHSAYGGPDGLKRLIDACHARGLGVILDVVYNHLGPEGNYLSEFGPYFSSRYNTPWGEALNFDGPDSDEVRRFFVDNALYWLVEYHVDGLRLDAVHAIFDFSAEHVLAELGREFHAQAETLGRPAWVIAESDLNDTRVTRPRSEGGWQLDAQWSDDFHHSLFTLLTGARHGYFVDFGRLADLDKALREGFVYDGRHSQFRRRRHGSSSAARPGAELLVCTQNHDQIANASHGRRLSEQVPPELERVAAIVLACAPNLLLLFQGQEWGETAPFHYFTSHTDPALARAVRDGRLEELESFGRADAFRDPGDERTFRACKLDWGKLDVAGHASLLRLYRELLRLRRETPSLSNHRKDLVSSQYDESRLTLALLRGDPGGQSAVLLVNFGSQKTVVEVPSRALERRVWSHDPVFWTESPDAEAPPTELSGGGRVELAPRSAVIYVQTSSSWSGPGSSEPFEFCSFKA